MTTYLRVKVKATGHQIDVVDSHYNADRHELVRRVPPSHVPRRPKYRVAHQRRGRLVNEVVGYTSAMDAAAEKTSVPVAVEGPALPIEPGTVEEEVGP